jgi:hypothetical protein
MDIQSDCTKKETNNREDNVSINTEFTYEFTDDPELLRAYYTIREQCYKSVWDLKIFSGEEDEHDRIGHLLVVRKGELVIGGARLVIKKPDSPYLLPMEENEFMMKEILPGYDLDNQIHGEVGRFSILPEFCGGKTLFLGLHLLAMAQTKHCRYLSTVAPEEQAKKYVAIGKEYGIKIDLIDDAIISDRPYYNNITMKLLIADTTGMPDVKYLLLPKGGGVVKSI